MHCTKDIIIQKEFARTQTTYTTQVTHNIICVPTHTKNKYENVCVCDVRR